MSLTDGIKKLFNKKPEKATKEVARKKVELPPLSASDYDILRKEFEQNRPYIMQEKGTVCCNCGKDEGNFIMYHHIVPLVAGGTNNLGNIAPLCQKCESIVHERKVMNMRELQLIGIQKAKAEGKYKGRKPIDVDMDAFKRYYKRWRLEEITARYMMQKLSLKPNTFYRRISTFEENMTERERNSILNLVWNKFLPMWENKEITTGEFAQKLKLTRKEFNSFKKSKFENKLAAV